MVIDRFSNAIFLGILASLYKDYCYIFYATVAIDIGSHWY
jgi:hypothetical protein